MATDINCYNKFFIPDFLIEKSGILVLVVEIELLELAFGMKHMLRIDVHIDHVELRLDLVRYVVWIELMS